MKALSLRAINVVLALTMLLVPFAASASAAPEPAPPAPEYTAASVLPAWVQSPALGNNGDRPAVPAGPDDPLDKVEPLVLNELAAAGQTDFFVWMTEQADLSPAYALETKEEKGHFVFEALRETARRAQRTLRAHLDQQGVDYRPFYIANKILVRGGNQTLLLNIASRPDVARITANHEYRLEEPSINPSPPAHILVVETNVSFVNADDVWALGHTGAGTVMAGNDTGLDWDHPALINQYRGWDGATADHNYNWWDATGTYPTVPNDGHGHGTHTSGTMVGDDGGANQIGVAPGARLVHCKNMTDWGGGDDATFTECFEWDLAPWDLSGLNPRPDLAPDAINNSWGYSGGGYPVFEDEIAALQAAGILVEVSAGNDGPTCGTLGSPGDYRQSLTTGSVDHSGGSLPGTLTGFSSRGPSSLYPVDYIPDIMAPGENIRSSVPGGGYQGGWSGTSMSGPHVTGLIGLMWSANPGLRGMVTETVNIIFDMAVPLTGQGGSGCGGDYTDGPNNDWGYGAIDALAAVEQAMLYGGTGTLAGTVTDGLLLAVVPDATIRATFSPTRSWQTTSDASGDYSMRVFSGTYTVDAYKYGHQPAHHPNITVISGTTTTLNIVLPPADFHVVDGTVTDATTGWPLYASISIDGYPGDAIWNDPVTGYYSATLAEGFDYTFDVNAWAPGYDTASRVVGPLTGNETQDFGLDVDADTCVAPGYELLTDGLWENFETWPPGGWTIVDNVGGLVWDLDTAYGDGNYTGGAGHAADVNSDANDGVPYDTELRTPVFDVATLPTTTLHYLANYQEYSGDEALDLDVSTNGGGTWTNALHWVEDHGVLYGTPGEAVAVDLSGYLSGANNMLRWRYYTPEPFPWDWYAQVDEVRLGTGTCVPKPGGLAVGNVYDDNTSDPLAGAKVANEDGFLATTEATPDDPAVDDGFYTLFSPHGSRTFTATMRGYAPDVDAVTVVQSDTVRHDFYLPAGNLSYDPASLEVTLDMGISTTLPFTLTNDGSGAAGFEFIELDEGMSPLGPFEEPHFGVKPFKQRYLTTERLNQPDPPAAPPYAAGDIIQTWPTGLTYAWGLGYNTGATDLWLGDIAAGGGTDLDYRFLTDGTNTGDTIDISWAGAFAADMTYNPYAGMLWQVDVGGDNCIHELDPVSLVHTGNTICPGWSVSQRGLAYDPSTDTYFAGSWNDLMIHHFAADGTMLDEVNVGLDIAGLAYNPDTEHLFAMVNASPNPVYVLDAANNYALVGQFTIPGFTDFGGAGLEMDCDGYLWAVDQDTNTVYQFESGETTSMCGGDVGWLSEDPISGTVPSLVSQPIDVTFDAGEVDQPGTYYAQLKIDHDTPYNVTNVPVMMTVNVPATWGKLNGTVTSLGHCDVNPGPLEGAEVLIENGTTVSVTTGVSGAYAYWLEQGAYTVTIFEADHVSDTAVVNVTAGTTTTQDFSLRWLRPCVSVDPDSMAVTVDMGLSTTLPMSISNSGAVGLEFELQERDRGSQIAALAATGPFADAKPLVPPEYQEAATTEGLDLPPAPTGAILAAGDVIQSWPSGRESAWGIAYDGENTTVWVGDGWGSEDALFEYAPDGTPTGRSWPYTWSPTYGPADSAFNWNTGMVWTLDVGGDDCIHEMDPATGYTGNTICGPWTVSQRGMAYDPETDTWYVGGWNDGTIYHIDSSGTLLDSANVGLGISGLAYNPETQHLFVQINGDTNDVYVLDASAPGVYPQVGQFHIGTLVSGAGLEIDCEGDLWAVDQSNGTVYQAESGETASLCTQDVPWLFEDPITGTVPAGGGLVPIDVTLDAAYVAQPGEYYATLNVNSNDPVNGNVGIPVTMTVNVPATWGKLQGTVTGQGYCDADPAPLEGAEVLVESWMTETITVTYPITVTFEDFEANDGGFAATNDWEWGIYDWAGTCDTSYPPAAPHSGTHMWGTVLNGCYNNLGDTSILSFTVDLSGAGSPTLSWWDWYDVYETWDHGEVYVNGDLVYDRATSYVIPTAWEQHEVDLGPYVGGLATIEFRVYATTVVERAGWYIDDVSIIETAEAQVDVPVSWLLETGENGYYHLWVDEANSPLTVTVTYPDHETGQAAGVMITGQVTTTVDFDLRWLQPCVGVSPASISATLDMGLSTTLQMNISNSGAARLEFTLQEQDRGFAPAGGPLVINVPPAKPIAVGEAALHQVEGQESVRGYRYTVEDQHLLAGSEVNVLLVHADDYPTQLKAFLEGYPDVGTVDTWDASSGGGSIPVLSNLLPYDVVIAWNNLPWADPDLIGDVLADYHDAGGNVILTVDAWSAGTWRTGGRFIDEEYTPFLSLGGAVFNDVTLGWYDAGHALMDGIGTSAAHFHNQVDLSTAAALVAEWDDGMPYVATKTTGGHEAVGINTYYGDGDVSWTTDAPLIVHNAIAYLLSGDVLWLSENPITGTVPADGGLAPIDVTLDADYVGQPGDYLATLSVVSDDPANGNVGIPVTMTVNLPPTYGKLQGTATSLGHCDVNPAPLEGAEVLIENGATVSVTTNVSGTYTYWLEQGAYTVTVFEEDHTSDAAVVNVIAGTTTTQDFDLRWLRPCISVAPLSMEATVLRGTSETQTLTLTNDGAASTPFELTEKDEGFGPVLNLTRLEGTTGPIEGWDVSDTPPEGGYNTVPGGLAPLAWGTGTPIPSGAQRMGASVTIDNETFYLIGGYTGSFLDQNLHYDPATGIWDTTLATMSTARGNIFAYYNPDDGTIYVPGGYDGDYRNELEAYDPASDSWTTLSPLPIAKSGANGGIVDGRLYLFGGNPDPRNETQVYDIASDTWYAGAPIPVTHRYGANVTYEGYIYVIGGWGETTFYRYDPATDTWQAGPSLNTARNSPAAAVSSDGVIYVWGGGDEWTPHYDGEYYDLAGWPGGSWTLITGDDLPQPNTRAGHVCVSDLFWNEGGGWPSHDGNQYWDGVGSCYWPGAADVDWLSEDPITGIVVTDSAFPVSITFTALPTMTSGVYTATLIVQTDDPYSPTVSVPVTLHVPPLVISEIRTTNVRDTSFTVSWLTNVDASSQVNYGTDPANLNQTAYDDRGAGTSDDTHYVTLVGLTPNTTYYFDVVSGSTTDDNGGAHYTVTTGPTLGLPGSDTIYGQVFKSDGTTPAEGAIVYITLRDADGSGSPGEAAPLSALVGDTGYWYANLGNARLADLSDYFGYSASGDQVRLEAQGAADGVGCQRVDTADDTPAADIVLNVSPCTSLWPIEIWPGWNHISLPLDPITSYTAEGVCIEINSQGGDAVEIDRWYASGWDSHICGLPFNDFPIVLGSDYFILSNAVSTWTIEGWEVTTGVPLDLQIGWNSIGVPHTNAYTAESLCTEIISQGVTAIEIDRWYASGWDGHICGLPFNDFPIEIGTGYFVKADSAGTVTPTCPAPTALVSPMALPQEAPLAAREAQARIANVRMTNLRDTSFAVSWTTDREATGYVEFADGRVVYDVRGEGFAGDTHYVVVTGLAPETTYTFDIHSGARVDNNGGMHYAVTTMPTLDTLPDSDAVYGQVFLADRVTPAEEAIVYITLADGDGQGSPGEASAMSALVDADGYWHSNLGNARLAGGSDTFAYSTTDDAVTLVAQGAAVGFVTQTVDTGDMRPAAPLIPVRQFRLYLPLVIRE